MEKIPIRHLTPENSEKRPEEAFRIRPIDTLLNGTDRIEPLHRHSFFYMLVLEKGSVEHSIDFQSYSTTDYTVFFLRPGQVHSLHLKQGCQGFQIDFTREFYKPTDALSSQLFQKVSRKNVYSLPATQVQRVAELVTMLFQEYNLKAYGYQEAIGSLLTLLFIELARQSQPPLQPENEYHTYQQERLEDLLFLIEQHCATHKQVSFYTGQLHLTRYQLNAITKNRLGKTCQELINDAILLEARRLLLSTTNQVSQIAFQLGYEDVSYFIRFFKKHIGYSPTAYRNNFR